VLSYSSTMQYAENRPTIPEIAEKLNVNYLVEGSIQRHEEDVRIRVQVIRAKNEDHVWGDDYDGKRKDIFSIQDEIAFQVAKELKMTLSPEEKQLIEKIPTANLTAYSLYQRGREEHERFHLDNTKNQDALYKAENLHRRAIAVDSTYAKAYSDLAWIYWHKHDMDTVLLENATDSALILANIALFHDNQLPEAYTVRGFSYIRASKLNMANNEFDKALIINPNTFDAYHGKANVYWAHDQVKTIVNLQKAASLNHGPRLPSTFMSLSEAYSEAGFKEKSDYYGQQALKLDEDTAEYYSGLIQAELSFGNFEKAIESGLKGYAIDSLNPNILSRLGRSYLYLGQYEESLIYIEKYIESSKTLGFSILYRPHNIGYAYWQNGYEKEAEYYFGEQKRYCEESIRLNRWDAQKLLVYYDLAAIYAFKGKKEKAYENLRIFNQREVMSQGHVTDIKNDPLFDSLRDETEFQQIVKDVETKYQAEHERVRQWLEENDML
jgi:tetratricopeptide (TPR) repeat protein